MSQGRFRVWSTVPAAPYVRAALEKFAKGGEGVVSTLCDPMLPGLRSLAEELGLELRPFGSVAREILMLAGERAYAIAPDGLLNAALAEACSRIDPASPFAASARFPGTHRALARTLHELGQWGIDSERLAALAEQTESPLRERLTSIGWLMSEVDNTLDVLGRQRHSAQLLGSMDGVLDRDGGWNRLLLLAHAELPPLAYRWLRWLSETGVEVTVVLEAHAAEGEIFQRNPTLMTLAQPIGPREPTAISGRLFGLSREATEPSSVEVEIESSPDKLHEVEWALRRASVQGEPEQTVIFAPDLTEYGPLIEAAAVRLGVPIRVVRRMPLLANGFARFVLSLLEALASPQVRGLERLIGSSYLGVGTGPRAYLRAAIRDAAMRRDRAWLSLREWAAEHEEDYQWLGKFLAWRELVLSTEQTPRDWDTAMQNLVSITSALIPGEAGEEGTSHRDARATQAMLRTLRDWISIEQVVEGRPIPFGRFVSRCRTIWEDADVSVPMAEEGVLVTSVPEQVGRPDLLIVLGMLEGSFPRRRREDPVLSDSDRRTLAGLLNTEPPLRTSEDQSTDAREAFYRLSIAPRARLVLSYPRADDDSDGIPAFFLQDMMEAVGPLSEHRRLREDALPNVLEADQQLQAALASPVEFPDALTVLSDPARSVLAVGEPPEVSPDELRDVLRCPFRWAARHRIRKYPRQERVRWARLARLPAMARMAQLPDEEAMRSALYEALESELDRMLADAHAWEMSLLREVGGRMIDAAILRETEARRLWPRRPGSQAQDVVFDGEHLTRDFWGMRLRGSVDAVAAVGNYPTIILYGQPGADFAVRQFDGLSEADMLFVGVLYMALFPLGKNPAVEIDSANGRRLFALHPSRPTLSQGSAGNLQVFIRLPSDAAPTEVQSFFAPVRQSQARALQRLRKAEIEPSPGDHCDRCEFGELCRRSKTFGEVSSPFDLEGEDE